MKMEIAVISGKGGTGKSSLSAAFATTNSQIVLADCDVDAANLHLIFNPSHEEEEVFTGSEKAVINYDACTGCKICINYCRFDAISSESDRVIISEILCDGCKLCARICPEKAIEMIPNNKSRMYAGTFRNGKMIYGRLAPGEENSGKLVNLVREKARLIAEKNNLDTILLDGPPGIGCPVISTITGVDKVIIITEPTLSGLNDMTRAVDVVRKFNLPIFIVINKYDLNASISRQIEEWCQTNKITVAGRIPFDIQITEAMLQGKSIIEYNSDSEISKEIKIIWNKILNYRQ